MRSSKVRLIVTMLMLVVVAIVTTTSSAARQSARVPPGGAGAPIAGVAPSDDYVIGAEDVLNVLFWREPDMSGDVAVRPDGMITLPLIGDIQAAVFVRKR